MAKVSKKNASTGPITEEGKFQSSRNSISHGLTATNIERFPATIRDLFEQFLEAQHLEWQPQTLNESVYVERYAFNQFQLNRAQPLMAAALERMLSNPGDESAEKYYAKLSRHTRALERAAKDALQELRTFIEDRLTGAEIHTELGKVSGGKLALPSTFPTHRLLNPKAKFEDATGNARRIAQDFGARSNAPVALDEAEQEPTFDLPLPGKRAA
jgi:hypothetical protein